MRKIFNLTLTLVMAVMVTACAEKEVKQAPLPQYSVEKPEPRDIVYTLHYPGFLQSEQVVDIISRTEGYLQKMNVKPGQTVKEGDVLFVIEPKNYEDKLKEAEASLETAKANAISDITKAIGTYNIDKTTYETSINNSKNIEEVNTALNNSLTDIKTKKDLIDAENAKVQELANAKTNAKIALTNYK